MPCKGFVGMSAWHMACTRSPHAERDCFVGLIPLLCFEQAEFWCKCLALGRRSMPLACKKWWWSSWKNQWVRFYFRVKLLEIESQASTRRYTPHTFLIWLFLYRVSVNKLVSLGSDLWLSCFSFPVCYVPHTWQSQSLMTLSQTWCKM